MRVVCPRCGYETGDPLRSRCPRCGAPLIVRLDSLVWRVDTGEPSMWRYSSLLPRLPRRVSFGEGYTPLRRLGRVYLKLENRNPTGSYADRASSLIASYLAGSPPESIELSYEEDFTVSLAYYLSGLTKVRVSADPSQLNPWDAISLARLGVELSFHPSGGSLEYVNPLTVEGLKTIAFEVIEASPPEKTVVVPAASGLLALAVAKGFAEAAEAGARADYEVVAATVEGMPRPPLLDYAPARIRVVTVSAEEAVEALVGLARLGLRVKPLSAAAYAAARSLGGGVAVVTSSLKPQEPLAREARGRLAEEIRSLLASLGEASAYRIWEGLGKRYSLRGVYKALHALELSGVVCSRYVMQGRRRVRLYRLCSGAGAKP